MPEAGYQHIHTKHQFAKSSPTIWANPLTNSIVFNFMGKISTVKKMGSIYLCEAFSTQFYLEGSTVNTFNTASFSPAW